MYTKILFLCLFLVSYVRCSVSPVGLPSSLKGCLADKSRNYATLTDEEAIATCMTDFMWTNNRRCKGISQETMDWLGSLAVNRTRTPSGPRERKEYRMLTDEERNNFHRAVNALKRNTRTFPNRYDALAIFHQGMAGTAAHRGPAFLPWHRYFLYLFEQALQEEVPDVMLPYWDSSIDSEMADPTDSVIWTDLFFGNGNGSIKTGPFADWISPAGELTRSVGQGQLMTKDRIFAAIRNNGNHQTFGTEIEMQHDNVHLWVGGHMGQIEQAPFDPVFYMHHAFIDCIWEQFRERLRSNNINPENDYPRATGGHEGDQRMVNLPPLQARRPSTLNGRYLTNKDGYRDFWTIEYYKCASFPECSFNKPSCGSKWLECNIFTNRCVSKGSAAALPKVTPKEIMKVREEIVSKRQHSETQMTNNFNTIPFLTQDLVFSGELFYSYISSLSQTSHRMFKRAVFGPHDTIVQHQFQVVGHPQPQFVTKYVTFPMLPAERVQHQGRDIWHPQPQFVTKYVTFPVVPAEHVQTHKRVHSDHESFHATTSRPNANIRPNFVEQPSPVSSWNIHDFYIPEIEKPCDGFPIQNTFVMDCVANTNLWAFVPIKVVHIRHGDLKYTTYPVGEDGRYIVNSDIYSNGRWLTFFNGKPMDKRPKTKQCRNDKSGLVKIRITSHGLNYGGSYSDHVFVDNRQPVTSSITFIGIKSPTYKKTVVVFTAVDQCGIACRAYCLVKQQRNQYPKYEECTGAVEITSDSPFGYATSYREAAKQVWCPYGDIPSDDTVMYADDSKIPVIFYCDYQNHRPKKLFDTDG